MNYSTMPTGLPTPNAVIKKLPVLVRDRIANVPMPVEYEAACRALTECVSIDEGKYWSDKADALAAWAKIYKSGEAALAARRLKLRALKVVTKLSQERAEAQKSAADKKRAEENAAAIAELEAALNASEHGSTKYHRLHGRLRRARAGKLGGKPGGLPVAKILETHGFKRHEASDALRISRLPQDQFDECVRRGDTVSRASLLGRGNAGRSTAKSDSWHWLTSNSLSGPHLFACRTGFRLRDPREVAAGIGKGEVKQARELGTELFEWLDTFVQALPK